MQLRNVSPLGHLDVPLLDRPDIEPGEVFDVTAEQAAALLVSDVNFEPVDDEAKAVRAQVILDAAKAAETPTWAGQVTAPAAAPAAPSGPVVDQPASPPAVANEFSGITGGPTEGNAQ